mmetsp:Transcript_137201/g.293118  ORF Transcript_137201/g.293118 Transcript_137201/m.293118 type:complete len:147 (-) Transcript_137201:73-513(-)
MRRAPSAPHRRRFGVAFLVLLGAAALLLLVDGVGAFVSGARFGASGGAPAEARGARVARAAGEDYWEGEWICADCGYIYNERSFGQKFEELQMGFKCPQCAAPRRRFARKLGDKIGTTLDGGDTPIILFSLAALVAVFAIAYFALN